MKDIITQINSSIIPNNLNYELELPIGNKNNSYYKETD